MATVITEASVAWFIIPHTLTVHVHVILCITCSKTKNILFWTIVTQRRKPWPWAPFANLCMWSHTDPLIHFFPEKLTKESILASLSFLTTFYFFISGKNHFRFSKPGWYYWTMVWTGGVMSHRTNNFRIWNIPGHWIKRFTCYIILLSSESRPRFLRFLIR